MRYSNFEDTLKFPSGRTVANIKNDAKKEQKQTGEKLIQILNQRARMEMANRDLTQINPDMTWTKSLKAIKRVSAYRTKENTNKMTESDLAALIKAHPQITQYGIMHLTPEEKDLPEYLTKIPLGEFTKEQNVLMASPGTLKTINRALSFFDAVEPFDSINFKTSRHSYELKHLASNYISTRDKDGYMSHGEFILAALFREHFIQSHNKKSPPVYPPSGRGACSVFINIDENSLLSMEHQLQKSRT